MPAKIRTLRWFLKGVHLVLPAICVFLDYAMALVLPEYERDA